MVLEVDGTATKKHGPFEARVLEADVLFVIATTGQVEGCRVSGGVPRNGRHRRTSSVGPPW